MRPLASLALASVILALAMATDAHSDVPTGINVQGRLLNASGNPLPAGFKSFTFKIFDAPSGGSEIWPGGVGESQVVSTDAAGLWNATVGALTPLTEAVFGDTSRWLQVTVDDGVNPAETLPRIKLKTQPFTYRAASSQAADVAAAVSWSDITGMPSGFADGVDNEGIGDITGVAVGPGILGGGTSGDVTVSADVAYLQRRVTGACAPGNYMRVINADGTVTCEPAPPAYSAGTGLQLVGTIFSADVSYLQRRVTGACAPGNYMRVINADGTVTCEAVPPGAVYSAGAGLQLVGTTFSVANLGISTAMLANDAVTSAKIADGTIVDADISAAAAIAPSKISGTVATLAATQTFTGDNTLTGTSLFSDSSMRVTSQGVRIGDPEAVDASNILRVERQFNSSGTVFGSYTVIGNDGSGNVGGMQALASGHSSSGMVRGLYAQGRADNTARYGVWGEATTNGASTGTSYGLFGFASSGTDNYGVRGEAGGNSGTKYGVYGTASGTGTNWAGYFSGNANVTGTLSKGAGAFRIDHPLDPANKYLYHSFVESPDMMNIYNGNVVTGPDGRAEVRLPEWFEALNRDFRYQLTVIGQFAQAIVSEEIADNRFVILTDRPGVKVSWQVTGVRKDAYAEAHRIPVEVMKEPAELGKYVHPEVLGLPVERAIDYQSPMTAMAHD